MPSCQPFAGQAATCSLRILTLLDNEKMVDREPLGVFELSTACDTDLDVSSYNTEWLLFCHKTSAIINLFVLGPDLV